ncbi:Polyketide cyclase SnoaL-like domain [Heracleum sosnowskyi]|uniref:Polyketide cyclase SnoaL-like domain n=1 Tax=Heracleum sosnowskyi TaxID=360622 RepID=A0AAD8MVX2_9APIA|nr:Polyketide cyclase SnoaL-like domain [Heracleum sosnowskyi]
MVATTICSASPFLKNAKLLNFHYSDSNPVIKKFLNKCNTDHAEIISTRRKEWNWVLKSSSSSSSNNLTNVVATTALELELESASDVVRKFYAGINGRDLASVEALIADDCVYEDLIFPQPFVGRKAILEFFEKFNDSINEDLQFVIDDISTEDSIAVGVTWHLEWKGKPFPFSKGCSFYKLEVVNGQRKIIYGRDSVEPAIKPGETALVAIRGVTWLLQQFPQLAERF